MKLRLLVLSTAFIMGACNSNPKEEATTTATETAPADTTAVALAEVKPAAAAAATTVAIKKAAPAKATPVASHEMTSESDNEAKKKKGWSKTAKGAVIGGVVGAGTGAAVNKRNRAVGAVVGGAVGAGTGAIIGNELDKKDGRH